MIEDKIVLIVGDARHAYDDQSGYFVCRARSVAPDSEPNAGLRTSVYVQSDGLLPTIRCNMCLQPIASGALLADFNDVARAIDVQMSK